MFLLSLQIHHWSHKRKPTFAMSSNRSLKWEALSLLHHLLPWWAHSVQNWNSSVGVSIAANKNGKCLNIKYMNDHKIFSVRTHFLYGDVITLQLLTLTRCTIKFIPRDQSWSSPIPIYSPWPVIFHTLLSLE